MIKFTLTVREIEPGRILTDLAGETDDNVTEDEWNACKKYRAMFESELTKPIYHESKVITMEGPGVAKMVKRLSEKREA